MHEFMAQVAWLGEVASLHPLFVGGPVMAGVAAGVVALRRRRSRRLRPPADG